MLTGIERIERMPNGCRHAIGDDMRRWKIGYFVGMRWKLSGPSSQLFARRLILGSRVGRVHHWCILSAI